MDSASWPQGFHEDHHMNDKVVKPMDQEMGSNNKAMVERKTRPQEQLNCPRCNSTNTKFCYYNNYSLTQPRYFCKTCRRYWTEGGSLRNVPVGGGSRKNKRSVSSNVSSSSAPSSSISSKLIPDLNPPTQLSHHFSNSHQNPNKNNSTHLDQGGQDLNLAFPALQESPALELLRSGIASRGLNSFIPSPMPDTNTLFSSGFPLQEFKPSFGFALDGIGTRYGSGHDHHEDHSANGRLFFPFGDHLKQLPTPTEVDQNKGGQQGSAASGSFWNGMLGGGSW